MEEDSAVELAESKVDEVDPEKGADISGTAPPLENPQPRGSVLNGLLADGLGFDAAEVDSNIFEPIDGVYMQPAGSRVGTRAREGLPLERTRTPMRRLEETAVLEQECERVCRSRGLERRRDASQVTLKEFEETRLNGGEYKSSWDELFFDLALVACFGSLATIFNLVEPLSGADHHGANTYGDDHAAHYVDDSHGDDHRRLSAGGAAPTVHLSFSKSIMLSAARVARTAVS